MKVILDIIRLHVILWENNRPSVLRRGRAITLLYSPLSSLTFRRAMYSSPKNCYNSVVFIEITLLITLLEPFRRTILSSLAIFKNKALKYDECCVYRSARFWLKKLLAQVHATQNIYLHNTCWYMHKRGP